MHTAHRPYFEVVPIARTFWVRRPPGELWYIQGMRNKEMFQCLVYILCVPTYAYILPPYGKVQGYVVWRGMRDRHLVH